MDEFLKLIDHLLSLNQLQAMLLIMAATIIFVGPLLIKKKHLRRKKELVDENIEDRNSWILYPKQYNSIEKLLMIGVYLSTFLLGVIAVNAGQ